jgi:hypothetical protein
MFANVHQGWNWLPSRSALEMAAERPLGEISMSRSALLVTTALVAVGLATSPSFAAKKHPATSAVKASSQVRLPPKVKETTLYTSSFFGTTFSGFTSVASVSHTAKKGGTLSISAMFQYCGFNGSYTTAATDIVVSVDGSYVDGGPFQAPLNTDDYCVADNWQGIWAVGAGGHTVHFQAYDLGGSALLARSTARIDTIP